MTSTLESTTTSMTTVTDTDIFILAPFTSYSACTTGIQTFTAPTSKTTTTSTITPTPRTITSTSLDVLTTTISCIPKSPLRRRGVSNLSPDTLPDILLPRGATYALPVCGSDGGPPEIPITYITTCVVLSTVDAILVVTVPAIASTTISTTSTSLPTTVCSNAEGSTTITPIQTSTRYTTAPLKTVTQTVVRYFTETVIPKGIGKCAPRVQYCRTCCRRSSYDSCSLREDHFLSVEVKLYA